MNPPLIGSRLLVANEVVFVIGGQTIDGKFSNKVYKISRSNPTKMEEVLTLKQPRTGGFVLKIGTNKVAILGGSETPLLEAYTYSETGWQEIKGTDSLSASFFSQLKCYTTDERLYSCCSA
jgi:hypothetical protein